MKIHISKLEIETKNFFEIIDLTSKVEKFLEENNVKDGLVNVFTRHTTVAIKINENELGFFEDLKKKIFEEIANPKNEYRHNDLNHRDPKTICPTSGGLDCKNGHSHIAQMLLGSASETIPVKDGKMLLGKWQRILMLELDRSRDREIVVTFNGS